MISAGNGFFALHPGLSFSYFIILFLLPMMFHHPLYLAVIFTGIIILNLLLGQVLVLKSHLKWYILMASFIIILNPLFTSRGATIMFYLGNRPFTMEALFHGGLFALSLVSILLVFPAYMRVITPDRFLFLFSSLAPNTAFNITVVLRFIPLLRRRLQEVLFVQQAMGIFSLEKSRRAKAKETMETFNILVTWSLESSLQTAASMRARGYETQKRSSAMVYQINRYDLVFLGLIAASVAAALLGYIWGYGQYQIYPYLEPALPVLSWHFLTIMFFLFIPIFLEGREWIQWHFIRSKM